MLVGLAVLRLATAALVPLTEDEAYYRLWSQHLSLGYYDHPPMIAWWIRAGITLVGDNALGVRLLTALGNLAATTIVFDLARRLGDERTGLKAALLYNCTLTIGAAAALAVPDAPAGLFWLTTLWALTRAWRTSGKDLGWWLLAGAAAGLATLSKYSALFMAPGVVLWLLVTPEGRRRLAGPGPWLAAVIAIALFAVNVGWNATHHWETFGKQFGRAAAHRLAPQYLAEFVVGQFVLLNPAVAILAGLGAARAWRERNGQFVAWLMLATGAPFAAYLMLHSLHDRVQAHWPVPLYGPAAILAAWACDKASGWRAGLARWAPLGLAVSVIAVAHAAIPIDLGPGDPALQLRGWPRFAKDVRRQAGTAWIGAMSYGTNAQLLAADHAMPALQINERERYADFAADAGLDLTKPGLVVDLERRIDREKLKACFSDVGSVTEIDRGPVKAKDERYAAVRVSGPKADLLRQGCGD